MDDGYDKTFNGKEDGFIAKIRVPSGEAAPRPVLAFRLR
jgi:hypothetical protein